MTPPDARARLIARLHVLLAESLRCLTDGNLVAVRRKVGYADVLVCELEADLLAPPVVPAQASMADAAEMLWVVLANVSGGDWTKQTPEWQEAAARWRDNYFDALKAASAPPVAPMPRRRHEGDEERRTVTRCNCSIHVHCPRCLSGTGAIESTNATWLCLECGNEWPFDGSPSQEQE